MSVSLSMTSSMASPLVMLSGFENRAEKNDAIRIIGKLRGRFLINPKNTQAFLKDCSHLVCTKPCRREKYLAACASGKWVLSPRYLQACEAANKWLRENDYQWSNSSIPDPQTKDLYHAPSRWRTWIVTKGNNPPFYGWNVGLIMPSNFAEAFIRIVDAGGGKACDISSYYIGGNKTSDEVKEELLTHILVTPTLQSQVWRKRGLEGIPHLRSDYLSQLLLSEQQPLMEDFSIFKDTDSSQGSTSKHDISIFSVTSQTPTTSTPKKSLSLSGMNEGSAGVPSPVSGPSSASPYRGSIGLGKFGSGNKLVKPLPASLIAKSALITISTGRTLEGTRPVRLPESPTPSTANVYPMKQLSSKVNISPKKQGPVHVTPTILLGLKRKEIKISNVKPTTSLESKQPKKRLFSEEFLRVNGAIMEEHISKKRKLMSYEGILNKIIDPDKCLPDPPAAKNPKPFSQEIMATLEAALEMTFNHSYFINEVVARIKEDVYPPPEVLYVMMKMLLLDSEEFALSLSTFRALRHVLCSHPPQANHIKSEKLYHKAFAAVTMPDVNESSTLLMAVGDVLSRANDKDWKMWTMRDQSLGVHWSFYSRVLNIATQRIDSSGPKSTLPLKFRNAALLTTFLTDLVVKDYHAVVMRKSFQSSMIKCLIAELLWPTMTGLEPWFRRPSTNLADLVSLFVKSVENSVEQDKIFASNSASIGDKKDENIPLCTSHDLMADIGRLVSITASWCVCCDLRDKLRGKRTSTRTLEHELVAAIFTELDNKSMEVIKAALDHLPWRTGLKVNVALIRNNCSNLLIDDDIKEYGEISLQMIASCLMKTFPSFHSGDNKQKHIGSSLDAQSSNKQGSTNAEMSHGIKAMKRNNKGETPLHVACLRNRPDTVRYLLNQRGIQPNATDYTGKTALGLACVHGSGECVEILLSLPLKPFIIGKKGRSVGGGSRLDYWQIDITLSPSNGQSPLHNALGSGHYKIACMLLEKGGVKLLDMRDSLKLTPLDYCASQALETSILQFACNIAAAEQKNGHDSKDTSTEELISLPSLETYEKALPRKLVISSHNWQERVIWLAQAVCLLISRYVNFSGVQDVCDYINLRKRCDISKANVISTDDLENYATDVIYCYRWKECWGSFSNHLCRLLGEDEESISYVLSRCETPISFDLCMD